MAQEHQDKKIGHPVETIATLALAFTLIGILLDVKWLSYVVLGLLFIGVFAKRAAAHIAKYWLKFAFFLGNVNSKVILTIVFFVFLTPLAFVYRLVKGDTISLKRDPSSSSYWHERNHRFAAGDFDKMF